MTEHDLQVARDVGELKGDMRALRHDIGGLQQSDILLASKMDALATTVTDKLNQITNQQSRGLGFFAGAASIITTFGAALVFLAKLVWAGKVG